MKVYIVLTRKQYDAPMALLPPQQTDPKTGEVTYTPTLRDIPQMGADLERILGSMVDFDAQRQSKDGQTAILESDITSADEAILAQWQTDGVISSWHWWAHDDTRCGAKTPALGFPCIHCFINANAKQFL